MRKLLTFVTLALAVTIVGCNSTSDSITSTVDQSSAAVTSFSLKADTSVLSNLDSVFFSIDLAGRRIFNADSLPKGTDVSRLIVNIGTPTVAACRLHVPTASGDTIYDYLVSQTDSIDFSRGPVTLEVISADGTLRIDYTVTVNVHNMEPDSLVWNINSSRLLPTPLSGKLVEQKTIEIEGRALCLTVDENGMVGKALADNPSEEWELAAATLPDGADLRTLNAVDDLLYVTDINGRVWESSDLAASWTATSLTAEWIIGPYNGKLLVTRHDAERGWVSQCWPDGPTTALPDDFPISAMSQMQAFESTWSLTPTAVIVGGRNASGALVGTTWAYDGNSWQQINLDSTLPDLEGMTLVPYFSFKTSDAWTVREETCLLAFGGLNFEGRSLKTVYISFDRGIHWKVAGELMQMPLSMPALGYAQALVFSNEMSLEVARSWSQEDGPNKLPVHSRVIQPITNWECPSIYLFGGLYTVISLDLNNPELETRLSDKVWKGEINRLTFRPLY